MKRTLATSLVVIALVGGVFATGTTAIGGPSKSKACNASGCHKTSSKVKVTLTKKSSTKTTVTYSVKVSGGSGSTGWALYKAGKNIKHKSSSTGTVTLTKGTKYTVRGVMKKTGASSKTITP